MVAEIEKDEVGERWGHGKVIGETRFFCEKF